MAADMRIGLELELGAVDSVSPGPVYIKDYRAERESLGVLEGGFVKSVHVTDVVELIARPDPSQIVEGTRGFRPDRAGSSLSGGEADGRG